MSLLRTPKKLLWTVHAREKMAYYRLSEQRVRSVLHSPKRIEEGVAPKTVAMMAPVSTHAARAREARGGLAFRGSFSPSPLKGRKGIALRRDAWEGFMTDRVTWSQEIWVMVQDVPTGRKIISAWRYPGVSKVRGEIPGIMNSEYQSYLEKG